MKKLKNSHAFTMVEMAVGLVLGGIVLYGAVSAVSFFQRSNTQLSQSAAGNNQLASVGNFLKTRFGGSKNFQHLSFNFPQVGQLPAQATVGTGYAISPNMQYDGEALPSGDCTGRFDSVNIVVGSQLAVPVKLNAAPLVTQIQLAPVSGNGSVDGQFSSGDVLILSAVGASEGLYLASSLGQAVGGITTLALTPYNLLSLVKSSPPAFANSYVAGDYVYKAKAFWLGAQIAPTPSSPPSGGTANGGGSKPTSSTSCTANLVYGPRPMLGSSSTPPEVITQGLRSFKITPTLDTDQTVLAKCPGISGLTDTNAIWSAINADTTGNCYSVLTSVTLNYTLQVFSNVDRGIATTSSNTTAGQTSEVSGTYVFQSNR